MYLNKMERNEGIILAGGQGTRMGRASKYQNKHTLLVYDRPMIEYPMQTLKDMGVNHLNVVSSPSGIKDIYRRYGHKFEGTDIYYETQPQPLGAAEAIGYTAINGTFPVLCGDAYFDPAPEQSSVPTLYWHEFEGAQNHSVWDPETNQIIEKPIRDIGKRAVIAYYYDDRVYDVIKTLEPTERGEIELIDLHNWYLQNGAEMKEYMGFFADMGTPDGLLRVANHVAEKK